MMTHRASLGAGLRSTFLGGAARIARSGLVKRAAFLGVLFAVVAATTAHGADMPSNPEKFLGMPWMPEGVSSYSKEIDDLFYAIFYLTGTIFFITEGLLIYFIIKYRHREGVKSIYTHGNHKLELAWTLTPAVILGIIAIAQKETWDKIKSRRSFRPVRT